MHGRETLTALFADEATAERAMERLRALGVPEEAMELHPTSEGDVLPGQHPAGLFAGSALLTPEAMNAAPTRAGAVVVATGVPGEIVTEAKRALGDEALEVDATPDAGPAEADERWDG